MAGVAGLEEQVVEDEAEVGLAGAVIGQRQAGLFLLQFGQGNCMNATVVDL